VEWELDSPVLSLIDTEKSVWRIQMVTGVGGGDLFVAGSIHVLMSIPSHVPFRSGNVLCAIAGSFCQIYRQVRDATPATPTVMIVAKSETK
jgi:hypothetical protein